MKIPNPFYREKNVRYTCKPSGCVGMSGVSQTLEVPDGTYEVLIEAVNKGRSDADVVFSARVWTAKWGVQDIESHLNRMKIDAELADCASLKEKLVKRTKDREPQLDIKVTPSPLGPPMDMGEGLEL